MTYDEYIESAKQIAKSTAVSGVFEYFISKAPFLALGPVAFITKYFLGKLIWVLLEKTELGAFFKFIDFRVDEQGRDFYKVMEKNHEVQKNGTKEEKEIAEKETIDSFRALVKLNS